MHVVLPTKKISTFIFAVAALFSCFGAEWDSYRLVTRRTPEPVPGLVNADFEDHSKFGPWKGRTAEIGRYGYNGNGGVRVWPRDKKMCFTFPFDGKLENGREYHFIGSFRKRGNVHVSYNWQSYGENGKYLAGAWNGAYADIGNGWETCEFDFTPPEGTRRNEFFIYCFCRGDDEADKRTNDVHCIDCDNLVLTESVPTWNFCNTWPIHNTVYNEEGRVRCHNSFIGRFFEKDAEPFYVLRLVTPDGKTLSEKVCSDTDGVVTCAFGRIAYSGPARLVAALYDRRNRLAYGTRSVDVTVAPTFRPKPGRAFITEDGRTLVDGKPFMPLGFWTGFANFAKYPKETLPDNLGKLAAAGFNTIVEYSGYLLRDPADRRYFYDQCAKFGIRVFAGECAIANWNDKDPDMPAKYEKLVRQYLDYPAIFAWFVTDEVNVNRVPELLKMRRILNRLAPGIPMWPCNIFQPEPFLPAEDVVGGDFYPYYHDKSTLLSQDKRLARIESCRAAAAWIAPQCYNWCNGRGWKNGKWLISAEEYLKGEPDENNMLANALHMASRGVTGFMFYSYFDMEKSPVPALPETRWRRMKSIAKTFRALEPFIVSGIPRIELPHRDVKGKSRVVALSDGKGNRRILIIGLDADNVCEIDRSALEGTSPRSRCGLTEIGSAKAVFTGGAVSCDIIE